MNFFYKRAFLNVNPSQPYEYNGSKPRRGHLMRVSSIIRGDQIANYLNVPINPENGYENDTNIYIKPHIPKGYDFEFKGKAYLDVIDGWGLIPIINNHPEISVIACSKLDVVKLSQRITNKIVFIPQQHCNFERIKRDRKGITTIGVVGTKGAFPYLPEGLKEELKKRDIELIEFSEFFRREDIIDFYKKIDLQIVWRPYRMRLSNPLKIVNASSFGIPTIAFEEEVFNEVNGCYVGVRDLTQFLLVLDDFINKPKFYDLISENCLIKSEDYHIDRVAKLYLNL